MLPRRINRLLYPPTDVGPIGMNWIVAAPDIYHRLSRGLQERILATAAPPAGAAWLRWRLADVPMRLSSEPVEAARVNGHVEVRLVDGEGLAANHVLLGTGYLLHQQWIDGEPAAGLRYRWEDGELLSLLRALAHRELGTAAAIARAGHDVVWAHYEAGDAGPLLARLIYLGRRGIETAARPSARRGRVHASSGGRT